LYWLDWAKAPAALSPGQPIGDGKHAGERRDFRRRKDGSRGRFRRANPSVTANTPAKGVTLAGEKMAARA